MFLLKIAHPQALSDVAVAPKALSLQEIQAAERKRRDADVARMKKEQDKAVKAQKKAEQVCPLDRISALLNGEFTSAHRLTFGCCRSRGCTPGAR